MVSRSILIALPLLTLTGCKTAAATIVHVPSAAVSVAKAPFRAGGKVVDWTTTSPSERDRAYLRRQRKADERAARAQRKAAERCRKRPDDAGCERYTGSRKDGSTSSA